MAGSLDAAVAALRGGRLTVFPTDTLWGIAARADRSAAVDRLLAAKRRPPGSPISVAVSSTEELEGLLDWSPAGRALARRILPGPFTVIATARRTARLARQLRSADGSLGVRVPDHPMARELARRAGPITATSANRHGEAPPRTLSEIRRTFGGEIAVYVDGGPSPTGRPSRLIDLRRGRPTERPRRPSGRSP